MSTEICETTTTTLHRARKEHHGLLPGDWYARVTGFYYEVGGRRSGYFKPKFHRVGFGPAHPAVLVGIGMGDNYPMPEVAVERNRLARAYDAVVNGSSYYGGVSTVEEADAMVASARLLAKEVEEFISQNDPDGSLNLRRLMGVGNTRRMVKVAEEKSARVRQQHVHTTLATEWRVSGGAFAPAGTTVSFNGQQYVLGQLYSKWVASSNQEYMGESVDGDVVTGRSLLCPETGKTMLRWDDRYSYPQ